MIEKIVFTLLAFMTLVPALLVVTLRNVFHAALWLIVSLTGVAGLFALAGSDFLFVAQLLVYSGGILILLLFALACVAGLVHWLHGVQTHRHTDFFLQLARGRSVQEVAANQHLAPSTVGTHLYHIKQKLNAQNAAELTLIALRAGLIET